MGVDLGTTSAKAITYDRRGRQMGRADREYPLDTSRTGRAEQDPQKILVATVEIIGETARATRENGGHIAGLCFSSAMHSLLAVDGSGTPLTPVMTWADNRAVAQAKRIADEHTGLYHRTGTPPHPMSPLTKLLWFREEDPQTWRAAHRWLSVKEYVLYHLTGEFAADHSTASATGLFNLRELDWDSGALDLLQLPKDRLSPTVPTDHSLKLGEEYTRRLGLEAGVPLIVGASDGALANLGVGATEPGVAALTIGTSGAVRMVVSEPKTDPEGRTFCYALGPGRWIVGGPINNGGLALQWARERLCPDLDFEEMERLAQEAPAGSGGLIFLPYLSGERAPHWNSGAKGVFFGLTLEHGREHLVRTVMEGVACQLYTVARTLEAVDEAPREYRAGGGFANSKLWRQILSDVFGQEILYPDSPESSCFGAALFGMSALGLLDGPDDAQRLVEISHRQPPIPQNATRYTEQLQTFSRLYDRLEPEFG